jgi:hypothetical protein
MYRTTAFLPSEKKIPKVNFLFGMGTGSPRAPWFRILRRFRILIPLLLAFAFSNLEELG